MPVGNAILSIIVDKGVFMVQGKWFSPGADLSAVLPVRESVFSRGADHLDLLSWNVLVYQDSFPAATGRIWWQDGSFWLGDICVLESYRRMHLGDLVLRLLLFKAQNHSAHEVRLISPTELKGFFSRLGFQDLPSCDSSAVEMFILGSDIDLDTCSKCPKTACPNRK